MCNGLWALPAAGTLPDMGSSGWSGSHFEANSSLTVSLFCASAFWVKSPKRRTCVRSVFPSGSRADMSESGRSTLASEDCARRLPKRCASECTAAGEPADAFGDTPRLQRSSTMETPSSGHISKGAEAHMMLSGLCAVGRGCVGTPGMAGFSSAGFVQPPKLTAPGIASSTSYSSCASGLGGGVVLVTPRENDVTNECRGVTCGSNLVCSCISLAPHSGDCKSRMARAKG
mmetsp:Transcript_37040/g.106919  ORF Transcript_37040/g.106919 Transcript_37040/m.106919 type:complete len:230 (+) Transcript_37040:1149-1838(+)